VADTAAKSLEFDKYHESTTGESGEEVDDSVSHSASSEGRSKGDSNREDHSACEGDGVEANALKETSCLDHSNLLNFL